MPSIPTVARLRILFVLFILGAVLGTTGKAAAQFSKPVCLLKGTVHSSETGDPVSVKVSVRVANDTAMEISGSRSNSATGNYLIVLQPGKKYWIHLESESILPKDSLIEIPSSDKTIQVIQDFTVTSKETGLSGEVAGQPDQVPAKPKE